MEKAKLQTQIIEVLLEGVSDIMFDKFIDHSKEDRPPEQKLYLAKDNQLVLPSGNITSFLFGELPAGCVKAFEGKGAKQYLRTGMSHVFFTEAYIPFTSKGKNVIFNDFKDKHFGLYEASGKTKMSGGLIIKQPIKKRPFLHLPWELNFSILLLKNNLIDSTKLYNYFCNGGILIALGTYRPRFGRFIVKEWRD